MASVLCQSAPITYTINRTNGLGSLIGTLTTDGTIGVLAGTNFVSSNLARISHEELLTIEMSSSALDESWL